MSDQTFITNDQGSSLKDRFVSLIKDTKFFDVLVGYFYTSGFKSIYPALETTEKIRILIGISTNKETYDLIDKIQSHKQIGTMFSEAVKEELEASEDTLYTEESISKFLEWLKTKKIEIRAYPHNRIHSKLYIMTFNESDRDKGRVITGSSNFTHSGLISNIEFNVELKNVSDYEFAKSNFEKLWAESVDVSSEYVETIKENTWLKDDISPYELYLKFLYEYFKEEINQDEEISHKYRPENFKELKYQDHAVINAKKIVNEYGGVFLSDVVGLGKTFMGTMLCQELPGKTLVLAPPHLIDGSNRGSWENAFRDFGFRSRDYRCRSIGMLESIIEKNEYQEFDNVLIDEAHRFRTEDNQTYTLLATICSGKKVILVTATPYNNSPLDLLAQIKLFQKVRQSTIPNMPDLEAFFKVLSKKLKDLDRQDDKEAYLAIVKENSKLIREKVLKYLMVRRTRKEISDFYGEDLLKQKMRFPKAAEPKPIFYKFNEQEGRLFSKTLELLNKDFTYARYAPLLYLKNPAGLDNFDLMRQTNLTKFMKILLVKRLESSFYAFTKTIGRFIFTYEKFIEQFLKGEVYISKKYASKIYEYLEQENYEAIDQLIENEEAERYPSAQFNDSFIDDLKSDLKILKEIESEWTDIRRDPKVISLKQTLAEEVPIKKSKILIFTESEETAEYLKKKLSEDYPDKVLYFSGKSSHVDRERVISNFDANADNPRNDFKFLITTDVLAEGVNLHSSNVVINYDIPWNPTRVMQRVGRINRVDTKHEEIFTYTFFPTDESDDQIKLKASAESKIAAFISLLGSDAKLLTDNEEVEAHNLFSKLTSSATFEESESFESELGYLQEIRKIRDTNPSLFQKIKKLPKKARSARAGSNAVLTYLRRGKLQKFFYVSEQDFLPVEKDFIETANILKAEKTEKISKFNKSFYELLEKNKEVLGQTLKQEHEDFSSRRGSSDNSVKLIKILKAKNIRHFEGFVDEDEEYISRVLEELEAGAIPKNLAKQLVNLCNNPEMILNPIKLLHMFKENIPEAFINNTGKKNAMSQESKEVILSEFFSSSRE